SQCHSLSVYMRVATGEMDWWPEAFPCRAAFAAVGLATREYIPGVGNVVPYNSPEATLRLTITSQSSQSACQEHPSHSLTMKQSLPW
ncbi:hypothetical protein QJQ45_026333, partial [Haematococcus lacustris]